MQRQHYSSGSPWEGRAAYSRAVRAGQFVFTAGTMAADESGAIQGADCYEQCCFIFRKLDKALAELGAGLCDVVKVTCFLIDLADAEGFMRAHREFMAAAMPAATCVVVKELFAQEARAEIELLAVVD